MANTSAIFVLRFPVNGVIFLRSISFYRIFLEADTKKIKNKILSFFCEQINGKSSIFIQKFQKEISYRSKIT